MQHALFNTFETIQRLGNRTQEQHNQHQCNSDKNSQGLNLNTGFK